MPINDITLTSGTQQVTTEPADDLHGYPAPTTEEST